MGELSTDDDLRAPHNGAPFTARDARAKVARIKRDFASGKKRAVPDWETNDKNGIVANSQENVRLALEALDVELSYDEFAERALIRRGRGEPAHLEDPIVDDVWLEIDRTYKFRPGQGFFRTVVENTARRNAFHPVRDYLDSRAWDGGRRIHRWLVDYAGADDKAYARAVGALALIAAVRRARRPGVKFDEMLILEAPQGKDKSSALADLCPRPDWFTDDLPLGVDAKGVIERTVGKWIVEAAELSGMKKGEVEKIKAFLSRSVDGPARLAYARLSTERPRHFVVIGTTNSATYLKDSTGNRRFWPVRTRGFDRGAIRRDRDQLWAEAAVREAARDSIRLNQKLWAAAGVEQEARRVEDPWEDALAEKLGAADDVERLDGKLLTADAWRVIELLADRRGADRTQADNERLGSVMRRLGFSKKRL